MNKNTDYLIKKYDIPTPRYTSYPTVPYWDNVKIKQEEWKKIIQKAFERSNETNGISIYVHLPYCESLCTFCGCNKRIAKNHQVEEPYISALLEEWELYLNIFKTEPIIKELHFGGGTPTFFSAENLKKITNGLLKKTKTAKEYEFSIEVHPNFTNEEQLKTLYESGFRRISIGVQDFDPKVQKAINRLQSYEKVKNITDTARKTGFESINFDLVYGLPYQKEESIVSLMEKVKKLKPERISFYSYAHVPWKSPGQRIYAEKDLPEAKEKRKLYELGRELLEEEGYIEIGMDHFSQKSDKLYQSMLEKKLHRNFMGYTTGKTDLLIGLGVSSISDSWNSFGQNHKIIEDYFVAINNHEFPIANGHLLSQEDLMLRRYILNLMCHFETSLNEEALESELVKSGLERLKEFEEDGLVEINRSYIKVTELGRMFIRNICLALDQKFWQKKPESKIFSRAI